MNIQVKFACSVQSERVKYVSRNIADVLRKKNTFIRYIYIYKI